MVFVSSVVYMEGGGAPEWPRGPIMATFSRLRIPIQRERRRQRVNSILR